MSSATLVVKVRRLRCRRVANATLFCYFDLHHGRVCTTAGQVNLTHAPSRPTTQSALLSLSLSLSLSLCLSPFSLSVPLSLPLFIYPLTVCPLYCRFFPPASQCH